MNDATCKTCPWCDIDAHSKLDRLENFAPCRINAPSVAIAEAEVNCLSYAEWPWVRMSVDWCGEHPERQTRLECGPGTVVVGEMVPTAADMRRIVDALEQMAHCALLRATP